MNGYLDKYLDLYSIHLKGGTDVLSRLGRMAAHQQISSAEIGKGPSRTCISRDPTGRRFLPGP